MRLITKQRMTSRERCARTSRITARPKLTQLRYSSAIRYDDEGSVSPNRGKQYAASQQLLIRIAGMLRITLALRVRVILQPKLRLTYRRRERRWSAENIIEFARHGERKALAGIRWSRLVGRRNISHTRLIKSEQMLAMAETE